VQTTLLGLAIALIVALVSALAAPLVVDWNQYRPYFEARASALVGLPVRIGGPIEARILPTPLLKLRAVEIGPAGVEPRMRVGAVAVTLGLGPLLRGELRATDMGLVAPEIAIGLNKAGQVDWPRALSGFRPDALSVAKLHVEQGRVVLADAASATRVALDRFSFTGEVRSLAGPFRGEGAFASGGEPYSYKVSAGRIGEDGAFRLKLHVDATNRPLVAETEGAVTFVGGSPHFDGTVMFARPAGATLTGGQRVVSDPWRVAGRVKAQTATALFEQLDFQYGPDERAIKLSGTAELRLGERPRLDGVFSARQIDFDRALPAPDATRRLPVAVIKSFVETLAGVPQPPLPVRIGLGVDAVTVGGTVIQSLRGDVAFDSKGWDLDKIEFRAPGTTQVSLSGRIDVTPQGVSFRGPATLDAGDLKPLVAWLEGRSDVPPGPMKALRARGEVTVGQDRIAIERLRASFDRETLEGRLSYAWADNDRPARLEAEVGAAELDLDAVLSFTNAARAATAFELPREVALAVDIGRATFAGVEARKVRAALKLDAGALQVERLSVADLGGAAVDASGRIEELSSTPRGQLKFDLDARSLAGVTSIAAKFAPQAVEPLRRYSDRLAPAKLRAALSLDGSTGQAGTTARLSVDGRLGQIAVNLSGQATGQPSDVGAADLIIEARFDSQDGGVLVRLAGLDRVVSVDTRPGRLTIFAHGRPNGNLRFDSRIVAGALDAKASGSVRPFGDQGVTADFNLAIATADARPLRRTVAGQSPGALPVALATRLSFAGDRLQVNDLSGRIGDSDLRGRLDIRFESPLSVDGEVTLGALDVPAAIAIATGMPVQGAAGGGTVAWSLEPFVQSALADLQGSIAFKADSATIAPALIARAAQGVARFAQSEIAFEDLEGTLAGGRLAARLVFRQGADGLSAQARVRLTGADAAVIMLGGKRLPIQGRVALQADVEGAGLSPAALIGSLNGNGTVVLEGGQFAGIDVKAFDVAMRVADEGRTVDAKRIQDMVAAVFDGGKIVVPPIEGGIAINAGQARIGNVVTRADGGELGIAGAVDLTDGTLDARLTLTATAAPAVAAGGRPGIIVVLRGPIDAPKRTLDVSALTGWLALRAADQQARQLEAIEVNRRSSPLGPIVRPQSPPVRPTPPGTPSESVPSAAAAGTREAVGLDQLRRERPPARSPGEATPDAGEDLPAAGSPPRGDQAPPLPAPIEVRPLPGSAGASPARAPARAENAPIANEPPRERKPPRPASPPATAPRPPLDLLFRQQN
jgi:hypothetical protein